jgi:hypothetical protein
MSQSPNQNPILYRHHPFSTYFVVSCLDHLISTLTQDISLRGRKSVMSNQLITTRPRRYAQVQCSIKNMYKSTLIDMYLSINDKYMYYKSMHKYIDWIYYITYEQMYLIFYKYSVVNKFVFSFQLVLVIFNGFIDHFNKVIIVFYCLLKKWNE